MVGHLFFSSIFSSSQNNIICFPCVFLLSFSFWQFAKEIPKYIEETKLRVILTSAPSSPVKQAASIVSKQEPSYEFLMPKEPDSHVLLPVNGVNKQEPHYETPIPKDTLQNGVDNSLPPNLVRNLDTISL